VAIGLVAAMQCACRLGRVDTTAIEETVALLEQVGLPTAMESSQPVSDLIQAMQYDKKTQEGRLRLVLPGPGGVEIVDDVPLADVEASWLAVGASGG